MAINSPPFLAFLAACYAAFLLTPPRARVGFLLAASAAFLFWVAPGSAALLLACSLGSYFGALHLARLAAHPVRQRFWLILLVAAQVAVLVVCKYSPLRSAAGAVAQFAVTGRGDFAAIALPLGFSYFLFQGIGYLVDTAWGRPAERSLPRFLLFMSFFPKVFMGPIERAGSLLPQIEALPAARFSYDEWRASLLRFGWGLFKKVVVADRLALYVAEVYGHPDSYSGAVAVTAAVFFALQLLADFSGYTDMVLGCAGLFHLRLTQNFEAPYGATNIQEFWRRWHVSFSSWIATFIFTPLRMASRRWKKWGLIFSVYVTFSLVGVWHGNGINFLIFGLLHGTYVGLSTLTLKSREALWQRWGLWPRPWFQALRQLGTFGLVCLALVFFRTPTLADALALLSSMGRWQGWNIGIRDGLAGPELSIAFLVMIIWNLGERLFHAPEQLTAFLRRPLPQRWAVYFVLLLLILCFGVFREPSQFIYLRF